MSGSERGGETAVTTDEEFREALYALATEAEANGLTVHGRWQVTRDDAADAWEFEIAAPSRRSILHATDGDLTLSSITEAITEREGVETTDLPPLHEAVDPDLLERLYDPTGERPKQYLTFEYAGYRITACSDGSIVIDSGREPGTTTPD